jgi:hypothetical protein
VTRFATQVRKSRDTAAMAFVYILILTVATEDMGNSTHYPGTFATEQVCRRVGELMVRDSTPPTRMSFECIKHRADPWLDR